MRHETEQPHDPDDRSDDEQPFDGESKPEKRDSQDKDQEECKHLFCSPFECSGSLAAYPPSESANPGNMRPASRRTMTGAPRLPEDPFRLRGTGCGSRSWSRLAALLIGGWLGGTIVYVHGMRVLNLVDQPARSAAVPGGKDQEREAARPPGQAASRRASSPHDGESLERLRLDLATALAGRPSASAIERTDSGVLSARAVAASQHLPLAFGDPVERSVQRRLSQIELELELGRVAG